MPPSDVATTREQLLRAAEELFARHGTDSVSLRKVNAASGARNAAAVQYHFGNRAGLVQAILDKHQPDIEARRHALLDAYEASDEPDLRTLVGALVRPLTAKLADADGGRAFLRIYAELLNRADPIIDTAALDDPTHSMFRWRELAGAALAPEAVKYHRRFAALLYTVTELGRRAAADRSEDDRLFTSVVIDTVTGILSAPVSEETTRLSRG